MVNGLNKSAIEQLYNGVCTITEHQQYFDGVTKQTKFREVDIIKDEPCHLSFSSTNPTNSATGAFGLMQSVKLFIDPLLVIPAGCKITVTQNNRTTAYKQSGEPAIYPSHQELSLELFRKWV